MKKHRAAPMALAVWAILLLFGSQAFAAQQPIVFGDFNWSSAQMHNRIAGFIIEHGYGYPVSYQYGSTIPIFTAMARQDIDATTEMWPDNIQAYHQAVADGKIVSLGRNYPDAVQGWYVPTYMIKGDPERGIAPMTPDLRSVADLAKYAQVFKDPEDPAKGRFYDCPVSWVCYSINGAKLKSYGLDGAYSDFPTGSQAALFTSLVSAYKRGEPWLGYLWTPTWPFGQMDLTRLDEPPYSTDCWAHREKWGRGEACAYPPSKVLVAVSGAFAKHGPPEVIAFLDHYQTTLEETERALAHMNATDGKPEDAALWF
ncbi:MAG TPA: ABC transporter substrate-binding protein, partial [Limnochordia bacterium]|nr:ABC transporter substrate-binding protein [Limnochordia bacterium]